MKRPTVWGLIPDGAIPFALCQSEARMGVLIWAIIRDLAMRRNPLASAGRALLQFEFLARFVSFDHPNDIGHVPKGR